MKKIIESKTINFNKNLRSYTAVEDMKYDKKKISKLRLIFEIMFNRSFFNKLESTIKYALMHHESYRGSNAADVMLLISNKSFKKLWKK